MGGGTPRASKAIVRAPIAPFRHSCAPLPSFLRRQEPAPPIHRSCLRRNDGVGAGKNLPTPNAPTHPNAPNQHPPTNSPKKIHPSPLPGGRLGGGWEAASVYRRVSGRHALSVIPAQAGTHPPPPFPLPSFLRPSPVIPASPLSSFLRRQEPRPPIRHSCAGRNRVPPPSFLRPPSVIPAQAGTAPPIHRSCLRRNDGVGAAKNPRHPSTVPAYAGMTEARPHATPNHPPLPSTPYD